MNLSGKTIDELKTRREELKFLATHFAASGSDVPNELSEEFTAVERELAKRVSAPSTQEKW